MNCPECGTLMNMAVQIGISCPSDLENKFTKGMFKRKDVQITHANWETASYICPQCGFSHRESGNYISKLEDRIKELEDDIEGMFEDIAGADI